MGFLDKIYGFANRHPFITFTFAWGALTKLTKELSVDAALGFINERISAQAKVLYGRLPESIVATIEQYALPAIIALLVVAFVYLWGRRDRISSSIRAAASFDEPPTAPLSKEQSEEMASHYSSKDRDNIADAFQELRAIIDNDVSALRDKTTRIQHTWPQLPQRKPDRMPNIGETVERLKAIRAESGGLSHRIFTEWLKKYRGYEALLKPVIDFRVPDRFKDLMHHCDRIGPSVEAAHSMYEKAENQEHQTAMVIGAIFEPMTDYAARIGGWASDTELRIKEQEKIILNRG